MPIQMWHVINYLTMSANTDVPSGPQKNSRIDVEIAGARASLGRSLSTRKHASHGANEPRPSHRGLRGPFINVVMTMERSE